MNKGQRLFVVIGSKHGVLGVFTQVKKVWEISHDYLEKNEPMWADKVFIEEAKEASYAMLCRKLEGEPQQSCSVFATYRAWDCDVHVTVITCTINVKHAGGVA